MSYFQESALFQQFLYITGLVACMCLSLRNVFGTTMLTMLGPGKALRGPDGSMHSAVDGMLDAFEGIIKVQHLSIYVFMATAVMYAWGAASMSWLSSLTLTSLVLGVTYTMVIRTRFVYKSFPLLSIPLVSGAFFPKPLHTNTEKDAGGGGGGGTDADADAASGASYSTPRQPPPGGYQALGAEENYTPAPVPPPRASPQSRRSTAASALADARQGLNNFLRAGQRLPEAQALPQPAGEQQMRQRQQPQQQDLW